MDELPDGSFSAGPVLAAGRAEVSKAAGLVTPAPAVDDDREEARARGPAR
ncbi:hypothetical protein [Rubellimicrobium roseum]|nr:hypothetical protein [Rubellimicrobium roseum]